MKSNKNLALAVASISLIVVIAATIAPISKQRSAAIDRAIETDFTEISLLVEEYYSAEGRLPSSIEDLKIDDGIRSRQSKFGYVLDKKSSRIYQLCANFKTDTSDGSPVNKESLDLSSSYYADRPHIAGYDCIDYQVYGYYYDDTTSFPDEPIFDFETDSSGSADIEPFEAIDFLEL